LIVPVGLHLSGRKCVVLGGGGVAARRVEALLAGGAQVVVVAPEIGPEIDTLRDRVTLLVRAYSREDLKGAFLVIAATNDSAINAQVARDAAVEGCLLNDADEPDRGDIIFPAVVRRGDLVVSVTTGGASPALSAEIRGEIERQFGPEYEKYLSLLAESRKFALDSVAESARRKRALHALVSDKVILELVREGRMDEARAKAHACILSSQD
jgi:precorrin-2 dehydrogenase/sirohydrochlorin ferrochelatase